MGTKFTSQTSSLKATIANVYKADIVDLKSKKIDTDSIVYKGQSIEKLRGLKLPEDYKKLISRVTISDDDLYELQDDEGNIVYMNYTNKIVDGSERFRNQNNIKEVNFPFENLEIGYMMFYNCFNISNITSIFPKLKDGRNMFSVEYNADGDIGNLSHFDSSSFPVLENGDNMFANQNLRGDLNLNFPNLISANYMFGYNAGVKNVYLNAPKLKVIDSMFLDIDLISFTSPSLDSLESVSGQIFSKIERFDASTPNLRNGYRMFYYTYLKSFRGNLRNLENGSSMFSETRLDKESILFIINELKNNTTTVTNPIIDISFKESFKTDQDILNALGVSELSSNESIINKSGVTWEIHISFY